MYLYDYYYGMQGGNNCSAYGNLSACKESWLHLSNNDNQPPNVSEWTMSHNSSSGGFIIYTDGDTMAFASDSSLSVRPVFYLNTDVTLKGCGTSSDPFIIATS